MQAVHRRASEGRGCSAAGTGFVLFCRLMRPLLALVLCCCLGSAFGADRYAISADEWARPHDGRSVVAMAPLARAVRALSARPASVLAIRYPGGEQGSLWAHQLRIWLIALGVPSARIELVPGSRREDALGLRIVQRGSDLP